MDNFTFKNSTKILFGKGQIAALSDEIPKNANILFCYGKGSIKKTGIYNQVTTALKSHKLIEFSGIDPNPRYEMLMDAVKLIHEHDINFILAVGGGSVIDGCKFISATACFDGEPWDILAKQAEVKTAVPLGEQQTVGPKEVNAILQLCH